MSTATMADRRMARRALVPPEKMLYAGEADKMFRRGHQTFFRAARAGIIPAIPAVARGGRESYLIHPDDARDYAAGRVWEDEA